LAAAATALFVGGHFALSSIPVRRGLIARLGDSGFRALYGFVSLAALTWMIMAYGAAPDIPVYAAPGWGRWVALSVMPLACVLAVAALGGRNITAIGGEAKMLEGETFAPAGIYTVTRHPMLTAFAIWAVTHLLVKGDAATLIMVGGILVLSVGGALHIDHRRAVSMGPAWGPVALNTSGLPFLAAFQGRTRIDWAGIGLVPVAGGLALYLLLVVAHPFLSGVVLLHGTPFGG
jgi:uncharacterized membrane protein